MEIVFMPYPNITLQYKHNICIKMNIPIILYEYSPCWRLFSWIFIEISQKKLFFVFKVETFCDEQQKMRRKLKTHKSYAVNDFKRFECLCYSSNERLPFVIYTHAYTRTAITLIIPMKCQSDLCTTSDCFVKRPKRFKSKFAVWINIFLSLFLLIQKCNLFCWSNLW